jgi:4-hydroxy-tetrahydrodipicolinate synthase
VALSSRVADDLRERLAGVVAVPVTPFADDGGVDFEGHERVLRRLVTAGVGVLTPNGNTGEFYALSPAEARVVLEHTVETAGGGAAVLAGVGHDVASAIAAAGLAAGTGAPMIMIHQPVHPYASAEGWLDYHAQIASAVPDLGVVAYIRDPRITGRLIAALAERCPNLIGVKFGLRDPVLFGAALRDAGTENLTWLAGLAELTAPAFWALGARGFTSGLAGVAPELSLSMLAALRRGDPGAAMKAWAAARPFEELRAANASADNVSVVKEALAQLGVCRPDVRPPSRLLPGPVRSEITRILRSWGLLDG